MKKDELIERLAERISTHDMTDSDIYVAEHHFLPTIVAFVAEWIEEYAPYEVEPGWLAHKWREEMG